MQDQKQKIGRNLGRNFSPKFGAEMSPGARNQTQKHRTTELRARSGHKSRSYMQAFDVVSKTTSDEAFDVVFDTVSAVFLPLTLSKTASDEALYPEVHYFQVSKKVYPASILY